MRWTLLSDPDAFFEEAAGDPGLGRPALVVLVVALVGLAGSVPVLRMTTDAMPAGAGIGAIVVASSVVGALVAVLVTWLLYAVAFHVISAVAFGADGGFPTTLALTGWGFVPRIPEAVVGAAITYAVFDGVTLPTDPARLATFVQSLRADPLFTIASVLGIAFLAWSALLWTFAMVHGRDLSRREAALTVAGPVGVALLLDVLGLVGVI